ncbi:MAG TPA: polysaccharide deacetylase family protein [Solirubrobacterales bacterium]|nr:polysaccharide deacetylase family protein [Solirubrobacterales bacterium]
MASAGAGGGGGSPGGDGGDLVRAKLSQAGRQLVLSLRTASPLPLAQLDRQPGGAGGARYLCLGLSRAGRRGERLLCLGGARRTHRRVGLELRNAAGEIVDRATLAARLKRPGATKLVLAIDPAVAGLEPHRYRWRVVENRRGCAAPSCAEALPRRGARVFRLRPVRPVGCTGGGAGELRNGPRDRDVLALTFDDGPSDYTEAFLDVLRAKHAHGTFFEIGQEMPGREDAMRRILREGDEIGDHTVNHVEYPGYFQIAGAAARIRSSTRFAPCLFRPPGGAVDSSVVATAGALGMRTILWDVDPADWSNPGSGAVYSRVVSAARPGSIVLMHDGGGDRGGTLAALPRIIDTLRARGYRFATVSELLGRRTIYRPYG